MSDTTAGLLQVGALIGALALCYRPLGDYMARMLTSEKDLRVERGIYKLAGIDSKADQRWSVYAVSVLAFSFVSVVGLFVLQRVQSGLPWDIGMPNVDPALAFNTAASFVTNTNWQAYSGESTMSHLTQMAGLAVQNFVSAAVGIAVVVAMIRGFIRSRTDRIGNFWVDLVRISIRILLPISVLAAIALIAMGAVQNLHAGTDVHTLIGGHQTLTGGPVASQEAIKDLGTNGGGFYNANSSHPFENPNGLSNILENFLLLLTLLGVTAMQVTVLQERMAGNFRVQHAAFERTEGCVIRGQNDVRNVLVALDRYATVASMTGSSTPWDSWLTDHSDDPQKCLSDDGSSVLDGADGTSRLILRKYCGPGCSDTRGVPPSSDPERLVNFYIISGQDYDLGDQPTSTSIVQSIYVY